jgi:hypothetical protein
LRLKKLSYCHLLKLRNHYVSNTIALIKCICYIASIPEEGGWKKQQRDVADEDLLSDLKKKGKGTYQFN